MDEYAVRRGSARLPLRSPILIRYPGVEEDSRALVGDLGMAGMFVNTEAPMPAGTLMHFEFRPSPDWRVLRGRGRVVWSREEVSEQGEQPGMGVRFIELEERGRKAVRWLIETYQAGVEEPLESWTIPREFTRRSEEEEHDALTTQDLAPISRRGRSGAGRRSLGPWLAASAVVLLVLAWLLNGFDGFPEDPVTTVDAPPPATEIATEEEPPEQRPTIEPTRVAETMVDPAPSEHGSAEPAAPVSEVLTQLVYEWASAWASQDIDRYLAFYSPDFIPESGISRSRWVAQRRERLTRPAYLRIEVDDLQVLDEDNTTPRTVFSQNFESDTFRDQVSKSLSWTRSEGSWRIVRERAAT